VTERKRDRRRKIERQTEKQIKEERLDQIGREAKS